MKFFIGAIIGCVIGFCYAAMTLSFSKKDAYVNGVNDAKTVLIHHLTETNKHKEDINCAQLMEDVNRILTV